MSTIIQIKRSSGTSAPSTLKLGELAYTYGTGTQGNLGASLFIGEGGVDSEGNANNITVIGGEYFTNQLDHAQGTLTASSALLVDSNKAIDEFFVGNSTTIGGQIKLNEGTDNGTNFIGLKAPNNIITSVTFTLPSADGSNGQILTTDGSGNLSFSSAAAGTFTLSADSGSDDTFTTGNTLTFAGGTGIDTTVSNDQISIAIDSTVTTNAGTQTLTNKTINTASNTITIVEADISDLGSYITASSTDTLTNKTFDANGTGNSISNIEVADLASGVLDTDLASVSASDDTLASAKAIKAYIDTQVTAQDLDFQADTGGALAIDLDSETLTFTGSTGIDTSGSGNTVTFAIDSTVTTNSGTQTLTNKSISLTTNTLSGTTAEFNTALSDGSFATLAGTETLTNKTLTTPIISSISNTGTLTLPTSTDTLVGRATTDTLTNKTLTSAVLNTGVSGTAILDEDNMASDSATQLATQQSIKAYVDAEVGAQDLDFQAGSGGALTIDLDSEVLTFTGGTGIDTSGSGNAVTFAIDSTVTTLTGSQTLTNKTLTSPVINTSISGTAILDEDNMASNSDTQLATQQSIKAYVDSSISTAENADTTITVGNTSAVVSDTGSDGAFTVTADGNTEL